MLFFLSASNVIYDCLQIPAEVVYMCTREPARACVQLNISRIEFVDAQSRYPGLYGVIQLQRFLGPLQ